MRKRNVIKFAIIFTFVFVAVAVPIVMNFFILDKKLLDENLEFLGSYIGATLGLLGVIITIFYTSGQNKKDRDLQIKPYFNIRYKSTTQKIYTDLQLGYIAYTCDKPATEDVVFDISGVLYLKNVGLGSAINCTITYSVIGEERKRFPASFAWNGEQVRVSSLKPGEEGALVFKIALNYEPLTEEDILFVDESGHRVPKSSAFQKYKNFEIRIKFKYSDVLHNEYEQSIIFGSNIYTSTPLNGNGEYKCDLNLREVSLPVQK